ncbi:T9SS type A sorting domain-containing protein, partial [Flavivirga aquimarina]
LYPNPVLNTLNISLSTLNKAEKVQVYNLLGKKVLETTNTTIDISYLSEGSYVLKVKTGDGKIAVRKFVKK